MVEKKIVLKTDLGNYKDDTVMKFVERPKVHKADVGKGISMHSGHKIRTKVAPTLTLRSA